MNGRFLLRIARRTASIGVLALMSCTSLFAQAAVPAVPKVPAAGAAGAAKPPVVTPNPAANGAAKAAAPRGAAAAKPTAVPKTTVPNRVAPTGAPTGAVNQQPLQFQGQNAFNGNLQMQNGFNQGRLGVNGNLQTPNGLNGNLQLQNSMNSNLGQMNGNLGNNSLLNQHNLNLQSQTAGQQLLGSQGGFSTLLNQTNANTNGIMLGNQLQQQLNLSSGQVSQINQFQKSFEQELNQLSGRFQTDPQGTKSLLMQAQQQLQQDVNSVLDPSQRQALSQATGTPNSFSGTNPLQNSASATTATSTLAGRNNAANTGSANAAQQSAANAQLGSLVSAGLGNVNPFTLGNGGFLGITSPGVQQQLNLSPLQMSQLRSAQLNYIQELGNLSGRFQTDPQGTLSLYNNALQQSNQQIESILTPQQRQTFSALTGATDSFSSSNQ